MVQGRRGRLGVNGVGGIVVRCSAGTSLFYFFLFGFCHKTAADSADQEFHLIVHISCCDG
jgi:hypothetical protein